MLKTEGWLWRQSVGSIITPILLITLSNWIFKGGSLWLLFIGSTLFWFIFCGGWGTVGRFKKLRRAQYWRRLAFANPQMVPLAQPQPVADPAAIPLPLVISWRPTWVSYPLVLLMVWIALAFWFGMVGGSLVVSLLLAAALALPLSVLGLLGSHTWLEVSEEGLTLRGFFSRRTIRWQEAELFAIAASPQTSFQPVQFELSSATTIVCWTPELKPPRLTHLSSPFPDYAWQMHNLLLLIAGKTGLPLHDLRGWQAVVLPKKPKKPLSPIRRIIANLQR